MQFTIPLTTEYHPAGLVMDEHSLKREGWLGAQTMPKPVNVLSVVGAPNAFGDIAWALRFRDENTGEMRFSVVGNNPNGQGWWIHYNSNSNAYSFIANNRPYRYVRLAMVNALQLTPQGGDFSVIRRVFIALRSDGRFDVLVEGYNNPIFGLQQPSPPTLTNHQSYTTEQKRRWEEAYLVAITVPNYNFQPPIIRSRTSNMVRILHDPTIEMVQNISLSHPNPSQLNFVVYVFKAGQPFFANYYYSPTNYLVVRRNEDLFASGVDFRFVRDINDVLNATGDRIRGMLSLGDRMVYWGGRGVYISNRGEPFHFGQEAGYTPKDGDGGIVKLPNVLFCMAVGSTLLAFTSRRVFRIVEAGQGMWVAVETDFVPPVLVNNAPVYRGSLYKINGGYIDVAGGESRPFGFRFKLLDLRQIDGSASLGMGIDPNRSVWVWLDENIYEMYEEYADFVFSDGGEFFLVSGNHGNKSELRIRAWQPVGWVAHSNPKPSEWIYIKSFPSEVYLERFLIRVVGIAAVNATIRVENFDNTSEYVQVSQTLEAGLNTVLLPKRLRASVFRIYINAGNPNGVGDYIFQIEGHVRALERIKGGVQR